MTKVLPPDWSWCVVSDLDGTLANNQHRLHHVLKKRAADRDWDAFHREILGDAVHTPVAAAFNALGALSGMQRVIVTARSIIDHELTAMWLDKHFIDYDHIFMRGAKDFRDDRLVKLDILRNMRNHFKLEPWIVLDDRDRVVSMWRQQGITCFQVADGSF